MSAVTATVWQTDLTSPLSAGWLYPEGTDAKTIAFVRWAGVRQESLVVTCAVSTSTVREVIGIDAG
jgi:hypothetical protein